MGVNQERETWNKREQTKFMLRAATTIQLTLKHLNLPLLWQPPNLERQENSVAWTRWMVWDRSKSFAFSWKSSFHCHTRERIPNRKAHLMFRFLFLSFPIPSIATQSAFQVASCAVVRGRQWLKGKYWLRQLPLPPNSILSIGQYTHTHTRSYTHLLIPANGLCFI